MGMHRHIGGKRQRRATLFLREAAATEHRFEIAFVDMMMPEMDGMELGRLIHNGPAIAQVTRVLLTSGPKAGDNERAHQVAFAAYLIKPIRQTQLRACRIDDQAKSNSGEKQHTA